MNNINSTIEMINKASHSGITSFEVELDVLLDLKNEIVKLQDEKKLLQKELSITNAKLTLKSMEKAVRLDCYA